MVGTRRLSTLHPAAFMVGARCLPTLHWEGVGGCASLTHPTQGRRWWVRVAYPPYIRAAFMVGARCLPTLHWERVYGGRASLTHPTLERRWWVRVAYPPCIGKRLWWVRVAYPPYGIHLGFCRAGKRRAPAVGGITALSHLREIQRRHAFRIRGIEHPLLVRRKRRVRVRHLAVAVEHFP